MEKIFCGHQCARIGSGSDQFSYSKENLGTFPAAVKLTTHLRRSVEGNNEWSFTSTPLCDRGVHKENFKILSVLFLRVVYRRSQFLR